MTFMDTHILAAGGEASGRNRPLDPNLARLEVSLGASQRFVRECALSDSESTRIH